MTGPIARPSRHADKRVAVPLLSRLAVEPSVKMPTRGSLLHNMTLQEDVAAAGRTKKTVPQEKESFTPIGFLCRDSEPDDGHIAQDPIGTRTGNITPARPVFSTDVGPNVKWVGGHYVRVGGIKKTSAEETQRLLNAAYGWENKLLGAPLVVPSGGNDTLKMYLRFDSMNHAADAAAQVSMAASSCETDFVVFHEFAAAKGGDCSFYDGQVIFVVEFVGQITQLNPSGGLVVVKKTTEVFGKVLAFTETAQTSTTMEFRVEYDRISGAHKALTCLCPETPLFEDGWKVTTKEMLDPLKTQMSVSTLQQNPPPQDVITTSKSGRTAWSKDANGNLRVELPAQSALPAQPMSMAMVPFQSQYQPMLYDGYPGFGHYGRGPQPYQTIEDYHSSADIFLDEIRNGHDVRTTIMLRNLPNNWGYEDLKDRLDEFCKGKYDFSYLRIDFTKNTNVGYGFVNFESAEDIIPLYEGIFDKPWVRGGRGRKASMSYATIQGIDCLVGKFRNSSVMDEFPGFGAKLWYTYQDVDQTDGSSQSLSHHSSSGSSFPSIKTTVETAHVVVTPAMVGTERPFPPPDNHTKHERSNLNAAQNDLWTGQRGRDYKRGGGRGSYSNWDRGTPRQMYEDFSNGMPFQFGYVPVGPYPMVDPYYQQHNGAGYGNSFYQHHSGPTQSNNRRQYQNSGHGAARDKFVSNDARNDARMPRSFSFENLQASQNRGGFNKRGGGGTNQRGGIAQRGGGFNQRGGRIYNL